MQKIPSVPNWILWLASLGGLILFADWLSDILPNWLQWVGIGTFILGLLVTAVRLIWRRFVSDIWAKRSKKDAMEKADNLIVQFRVVQELQEDALRLQAISTTAVADMILSIVMLAVSIALFATAYLISDTSIQLFLPETEIPNSPPFLVIKNIYFFVAVLALFVMIKAIARMSDAWINQETLVRPHVDWNKYFNRTTERIQSLLAKAGMDDHSQGQYINDIIQDTEVEFVRTDEPGPDTSSN